MRYAKKLKQNRPLPNWVRYKTDNTIRYLIQLTLDITWKEDTGDVTNSTFEPSFIIITFSNAFSPVLTATLSLAASSPLVSLTAWISLRASISHEVATGSTRSSLYTSSAAVVAFMTQTPWSLWGLESLDFSPRMIADLLVFWVLSSQLASLFSILSWG